MGKTRFRLRGQQFALTSDGVSEALDGIPPETIREHYVVVNSRRYPIKQALSVVLRRPRGQFITTDAVRIFRKLGFETGVLSEPTAKGKTESELLFEDYLKASGLGYFRHERDVVGTRKRPDYSLSYKGQELFFEVKQFVPEPKDFSRGSGAYDPYPPIREKIEAGRKKFKDIDGYVCCLVLFNAGKPLIHLSWKFIFAAMLGDLTIQMPFDRERGMVRVEEAQTTFGKRGKMRRYAGDEPIAAQNKTISAIIVLEHLPIGQRRLSAAAKRKGAELGRNLAVEEFWRFMESARGTERDPALFQLRVVVHDNPDAAYRLPADIFRGPFDERYGVRDGMIVRVFAGEEVIRLEVEEEEVSKVLAPE